VREQVLADHQVLRDLRRRVLAAARRYLRHESQSEELRVALRELRGEIERHNDYEERMLAALLFDSSVEGRRRVVQMTQDHAGQHAALVALTEDAGEGGRNADELVDELVWFAQGLDRDMEAEELALVRDDALGIRPSAAVTG
jgi:hypothetical protein